MVKLIRVLTAVGHWDNKFYNTILSDKLNKPNKLLLQSIAEIKVIKAGYTATPVACGWAAAVFEVTREFGRND